MRGVVQSLYASKVAYKGSFTLSTMTNPLELNVELSICAGVVCFGGSLSLLVGPTFVDFPDKFDLVFLDLLEQVFLPHFFLVFCS